MDPRLIVGALALVLTPLLFAVLVVIEARRVARLIRHGVVVEGEVIGEELHGIKNKAPYPVVQFRTPDGNVRQFRSMISRRNRGFIHLEKVIVRYLPECPDRAELFSSFHPYKHLAGAFVAFLLAATFALLGLPLILQP